MSSLTTVVGTQVKWFLGATGLAVLGGLLIVLGGRTSWAELWLVGFPLFFVGIAVAGAAMVWALIRAIRAYVRSTISKPAA